MLVIDLLWLISIVLDVRADFDEIEQFEGADCFSGEHLAIDSFMRLLSMLLLFDACCFNDLAEKVARTTLFAVAEVRVCLAFAVLLFFTTDGSFLGSI